jgi:L-lactate dehydrogenase (cytochrome)
MARQVTNAELAAHSSARDLWLAIHGKVYDLTSFLSEHPGGVPVLLKAAGKDATRAFSAVHPPDMLSLLPPAALVGTYDAAAAGPLVEAKAVSPAAKAAPSAAPASRPAATNSAPPQERSLEEMLNAADFEPVAQRRMEEEGWAYYSSGAEDEISLRDNRAAFQRIWLRPRVLVNVKEVDPSVRLLQRPSALPLYISATALGRLAHPDGELAIIRACAAADIMYMLPTFASCSFAEMLAARAPKQPVWLQLYVNPLRERSEAIIREAEAKGVCGLFVTVDAPQLGKREKDQRLKTTALASQVAASHAATGRLQPVRGTGRTLSVNIDPSLCWADITWLRSVTKMPLVLKGIQCGEDAVLAAKHGVQGIVLSNHGGRQLDTARSGIEILPEVVAHLRKAGLLNKLEIYVDGGVKRGSDIFKALALGAKAVGIGRPVLHALAAFGQPGVERLLQILYDEFILCMRLMGVTSIAQIRPEMAIAESLSFHGTSGPKDFLSRQSYAPLPRL